MLQISSAIQNWRKKWYPGAAWVSDGIRVLLETLALIPASVERLSVLYFVEIRMIVIYICMCSFFLQHFNTLSFSFCTPSISVIEFYLLSIKSFPTCVFLNAMRG